MSNFLFFTIGKVGDSNTEAKSFKKYVGIGNAKVLAVNPTKAELKELAGYEPQEEPAYIGVQEVEGKSIPYARITFLMKVEPENNNGAEFTHQLSFFIRKQYNKGSQSGKYEVYDDYGNTAWGEEEVVKAHKQIMYANGPANIIGDYQPAYIGYTALVDFLRKLAAIPNSMNYANGTFTPKTGQDLADSALAFSKEEIEGFFKGNVTPLKEIVAMSATNTVKGVFGVRTNPENGNEFQDMYSKVLRGNAYNTDSLVKEITETQNRGGLNNRVFEFTPIHEYVVTPTDMSVAPAVEDDPFAGSTVADPWS